jgi:hypothetical protein
VHEPSKTLDLSHILPAAQHPTHAALIESKRKCECRINTGILEQPFLLRMRAAGDPTVIKSVYDNKCSWVSHERSPHCEAALASQTGRQHLGALDRLA